MGDNPTRYKNFDTLLIQNIYNTAKALSKNPAYYYAQIPTCPCGGIEFIYVSDILWENGFLASYPPGLNN